MIPFLLSILAIVIITVKKILFTVFVSIVCLKVGEDEICMSVAHLTFMSLEGR